MSRYLHNQIKHVDMRNGVVYAKAKIIKGTKFGPFIGQFTNKPENERFAWQVSCTKFDFIKMAPSQRAFSMINQHLVLCARREEPFDSRPIVVIRLLLHEFKNIIQHIHHSLFHSSPAIKRVPQNAQLSSLQLPLSHWHRIKGEEREEWKSENQPP